MKEFNKIPRKYCIVRYMSICLYQWSLNSDRETKQKCIFRKHKWFSALTNVLKLFFDNHLSGNKVPKVLLIQMTSLVLFNRTASPCVIKNVGLGKTQIIQIPPIQKSL